MPLKAKITNPAFRASVSQVKLPHLAFYCNFLLISVQMSTAASVTQEQPGDDPDDVIFNSFYGARTIELNRPKKLNSLNGSMARKIIARLLVRLRRYTSIPILESDLLTQNSNEFRNGKNPN